MSTIRNERVTDKDVLVEWIADVSAALHQPEQLLAWLRAVLHTGAEQQVFTVLEAPLLHHQRDRNDPLADSCLHILPRLAWWTCSTSPIRVCR